MANPSTTTTYCFTELMRPNTVDVDTSTQPATLTFAETFNVAVPFIDRHLAEGRGDQIAIREVGGDTTYRELTDGVNRAGNALATLGLARGDRVILAIKDCPAFFFVFWGAIKAGFVPVPVNTLLRSHDYRFMIEDSGAACVIWSPEFGPEIQPALAALATPPPSPVSDGRRRRFLGVADGSSGFGTQTRAGGGRFGLLLAIHIWFNRHAERRRPRPQGHGCHQPVLRC